MNKVQLELKGKRGRLISKHLRLAEFECKCSHPECSVTYIDYRVGVCFENLRALLGNKPLYITSGYRCIRHNHDLREKYGTSELSQHMLGRALDIAIPPGVEYSEMVEKANQSGFTFVYAKKDKGFVHCDIR